MHQRGGFLSPLPFILRCQSHSCSGNHFNKLLQPLKSQELHDTTTALPQENTCPAMMDPQNQIVIPEPTDKPGVEVVSTPPPQFRPIANPAVLGLCAFATTTFTLSCFNAHIVPKTAEGAVLGLAFFYGGAVQLIAGIWEYTLNNTFGATAFCSYGAFWMSFAWYVSYVVAGIPAADRHHATGIFLCAWTIFSFVMLIGSYRTNVGLFSLFCVLEITFILLTIGNFRQSEGTIKAGGWFGLLLAFMAWYIALSNLLKATWKEDVLPLKSMEKKKN